MANDILMFLENKDDGKPVKAECQVSLPTGELFLEGFKAGYFFELEDFDFSLRLVGDEGGNEGKSQTGGAENTVGVDKTSGATAPKKSGAFSRWMQGGDAKLYQPEMDTISVTRYADSASPRLFQNCFGAKEYKRAVVIKRKAGQGLGDDNSFVYFRIEFTEVLLTALDWDAEEKGIKEKIKFVARSVLVQYRPQNPDGSAGTPVPGRINALIKTTAGGKG